MVRGRLAAQGISDQNLVTRNQCFEDSKGPSLLVSRHPVLCAQSNVVTRSVTLEWSRKGEGRPLEADVFCRQRVGGRVAGSESKSRVHEAGSPWTLVALEKDLGKMEDGS